MEIRYYRITTARSTPGTRCVSNLISDKNHLTKKPQEREKCCNRRVTNIRTEVDKAVARVVEFEHVLKSFIELESQARRDKAFEAPNQESIDRLVAEI